MAVKAPVLLCAATRWEADPLIKRWGLRRVDASRHEGAVGGADIVLVKTGMGAVNAAAALDALVGPPPRMAVSIGFAGALQPRMASGDLVLDVQGAALEIPEAAREIAARQNSPLHFGRIAHSDVVLHLPRDKRELGERLRCSAVDMESEAVRRWAQARQTAMIAARVVLDDLDSPLPPEAPAGETARDLAAFAWRNAGRWPSMVLLGLRQRRAMARLAAFLEELLPRL